MDLVLNCLGGSLRDFAKQSEPRFSLRKGYHDWFLPFSDHRIDLPVAQTLSAIDHGWTLFNAMAVRQFSPSIILSVAFASLFLATQVSVEVSACLLILQNILIDPFMTDTNPFFLFQPARDLFRAPILSQQPLHPHPCLGRNPGYTFLSAFHRQAVSLLRTIAASPSISLQFAAHAGFMDSDHLRNLRTRMSGFLQRINLVSLSLGKLGVGPLSAPLTWSSKKALSYSSLPLSTTFKVALVS